jgi:hypothetical protein
MIGTSEITVALSIIVALIFFVLILRLLFKLKWN